MVDGDELAAVGVAAEHQVRPGRRLRVKVVGLVVQQDDVLIPVQPGHQFLRRFPSAAGLLDAPVLPAGDIEPAVHQARLILQDDDAVFFQRGAQLRLGPAPRFLTVIAPVMVAEHEEDAAGRFQLPQRGAAAQHILPRGVVVHKITRNDDHIRRQRIDLLHIARKAIGMEGRADVAIRDLRDAQRRVQLRRGEGIFRLPNMMVCDPSRSKINHAERHRRSARGGTLWLLMTPAGQQARSAVAQQPEQYEVDHADHRVHHVPRQPQRRRQRSKHSEAEKSRRRSFSVGQALHNSELRRPKRYENQPRRKGRQQAADHGDPHPHRSSTNPSLSTQSMPIRITATRPLSALRSSPGTP